MDTRRKSPLHFRVCRSVRELNILIPGKIPGIKGVVTVDISHLPHHITTED